MGSDVKVKGTQLRYLTDTAEVEKLISGTDTGDNGTAGEFLKVKGTALYWTDNNGDIRSKVGTLTGNTGTAGQRFRVKGDYVRYIDDDGNERRLAIIEGNLSAVVDTLAFDASVGQTPHIVRVAGDIYAVAYTGVGSDGYVTTFTIDSATAHRKLFAEFNRRQRRPGRCELGNADNGPSGSTQPATGGAFGGRWHGAGFHFCGGLFYEFGVRSGAGLEALAWRSEPLVAGRVASKFGRFPVTKNSKPPGDIRGGAVIGASCLRLLADPELLAAQERFPRF